MTCSIKVSWMNQNLWYGNKNHYPTLFIYQDNDNQVNNLDALFWQRALKLFWELSAALPHPFLYETSHCETYGMEKIFYATGFNKRSVLQKQIPTDQNRLINVLTKANLKPVFSSLKRYLTQKTLSPSTTYFKRTREKHVSLIFPQCSLLTYELLTLTSSQAKCILKVSKITEQWHWRTLL